MTALHSWLFVIETFLVLYLFWKLMLWVCELVEWALRERRQNLTQASADRRSREAAQANKGMRTSDS